MDTLAALGAIFGWAFFSFWSAIPAGLGLRLTPLLVVMTVTASYASGVILVVLAGVPLRQRIQLRLLKQADILALTGDQVPTHPAVRRAQIVWQRFGLPGLALLAPMTLGAQLGAIIGLAFGARPGPLILAMTLGAAAWAAIITGLVLAGVMVVS